jgi:acyl homoserine lactone synthase
MLIVIERHNAAQYKNIMEEMFCLRARIFRDRLNWDVNVINGLERDKYDDEAPVYLIHYDENVHKIKGSLRLLPTTGPTVLTEFFSDTLPSGAQLSAPTIWECTRFCLDDKIQLQEELYFASAILIAALGELALRAGIESILGNFDSAMLRLYRRVGCEVDVLGSTTRYGYPIYLGLFSICDQTVQKVKRKLQLWQADGAAQSQLVVA